MAHGTAADTSAPPLSPCKATNMDASRYEHPAEGKATPPSTTLDAAHTDVPALALAPAATATAAGAASAKSSEEEPAAAPASAGNEGRLEDEEVRDEEAEETAGTGGQPSPGAASIEFTEDEEEDEKGSEFNASDEEEEEGGRSPGDSFSDSDSDGGARRRAKRGTRQQPSRRGKRGRADEDEEEDRPGVRRSRRNHVASSEAADGEERGSGDADGNADEDEGSGSEGRDGQGSESDSADLEEAEPLVLERSLSEQEGAEQLAAVWAMWEWGVVLNFMSRFKGHLGFLADPEARAPPNQLASEIVHGVGDEGLLCSVHLAILGGLTSKLDLGPSNWPAYVAIKLRGWTQPSSARANAKDLPLFEAQRGREAEAYCAMPATQRVLVLKALCELRADREDIRSRLETAANPPRSAKVKAAAKPPPGRRSARTGSGGPAQPGADKEESLVDFRAAPFGRDAQGRAYHYLDYMGSCDAMVFREAPPMPRRPLTADPSPPLPPLPPAAGKKGGKGAKRPKKNAAPAKDLGGSRAQEPMAGGWELLGCGVAALEVAAAELASSGKKDDQRVAQWIEDEAVAVLKAREEEEERLRRVKERLSRRLGIPAAYGAGAEGSRRERKAVRYTFDDYDRAIKEAMRHQERRDDKAGRGRTEPPPPAKQLSRAERAMQRHESVQSLASGNQGDAADDELPHEEAGEPEDDVMEGSDGDMGNVSQDLAPSSGGEGPLNIMRQQEQQAEEQQQELPEEQQQDAGRAEGCVEGMEA